MQNWLVQSASEVETNFVSVERVMGCIQLPSEAALHLPTFDGDQARPPKGEIEFK